MNFIGGKLKLKNQKNDKSLNQIRKVITKDIKPERRIEKEDEKIAKNEEEYMSQLIKEIENPISKDDEELFDERTEAEKLFDERKNRRMPEKIYKKLLTSYKQKTEIFKNKLSKLPQHNDIPKVGPG